MPQTYLSPYEAKQQSLNRRRQMAQLLQQQSMAPMEEPNYPGAQISPWQGAAKLAQALIAGLTNRKLDQEQTGLSAEIQGQRNTMMEKIARAAIPEAQGTTGILPMAPTQNMPVSDRISPTDYPNVTPPPGPGMTTPEGSRSIQIPAASADVQRVQALKAALADPLQPEFGQAMLANEYANQRQRGSAQEQMARLLLQQQFQHQENAPLHQAEIAHLGAQTSALGHPAYIGVPQGGALFNEQTGQSVFTNPAKPTGPTTPKANFSNNGVPYSVTKGEQEWTLGDPTMPPDVKAVGEAAIASHKQRLQEGADIEERKAARQSERDDALAKLRNANAPDQIKTQVSAAYSTKDMIDVVRDIVRRKPQLVGPAVGRLEQKAQGIGTSFGLQNPEDERDASTLNGHLAYLFANELRAAFPNRPNKEVISELKKAAAQIQQNPNILEGMLRSAENNANIAIQGGQRWGINIGAGAGQGQSGGLPTVGGTFNGAKVLRVTPVR